MSFTTPARVAHIWSRGLTLALSCILSLAAGERDRAEQTAPELPWNMHADNRLNDVLLEMLRESPTFRAQCARLQNLPHLRLRLTLEPHGASQPRRCRALCVIRRYEYGSILATVQLRSLGQAAELVAHEFEHVLEYVEGLDYRAASRRPTSEVWKVSEDHFETGRAIDAGRRVATEIIRSRSARLQRAGQSDATRP